MKNSLLNKTLCVSVFSLAVGFATNLAAGELENTYVQESARGVPSIHVQYVASELATEQGRAKLHRRVSMAAREVCGPMTLQAAGGVKYVSHNRQCYDEAKQAAWSQIDGLHTAALAE